MTFSVSDIHIHNTGYFCEFATRLHSVHTHSTPIWFSQNSRESYLHIVHWHVLTAKRPKKHNIWYFKNETYKMLFLITSNTHVNLKCNQWFNNAYYRFGYILILSNIHTRNVSVRACICLPGLMIQHTHHYFTRLCTWTPFGVLLQQSDGHLCDTLNGFFPHPW